MSPAAHIASQVEHDFILPAERETFIEQMKDVMDKAEDMLSEDTDADRGSDAGTSPPPLGSCGLVAGEVRAQVPREGGGGRKLWRECALDTGCADLPSFSPPGRQTVPSKCPSVPAEW